MDNIEQKISNLIQYQFPAFYRTEGPTFIAFVKAYFEWMEEEGNPIHRSRNLLNYIDVDNTLDEFLIHFQKKYLYGIPFDVVINKRFLLKHILDVYQSKGSIQGYRLLFRLIYNQDVDVYLPGDDVLRVSDGTWVENYYIEVSDNGNLNSLVGKTIVGVSSTTTAVVESFVKEVVHGSIVSTLYLSNIVPKGGDFVIGEKVINKDDLDAENVSDIILEAPAIQGSLDYIEIETGGTGFSVGDTLKIASVDLDNNQIISGGKNGIVKVASTFRGKGSISFVTDNPGSGYLANSIVRTYNHPSDTTGFGASFNLNNLNNLEEIRYNTNLLADHTGVTLQNLASSISGNVSSNSSSQFQSYLSFSNGIFGSVLTLTDIRSGQDYTQPVINKIVSPLMSNNLSGNVSYSNSSLIVTGTGTDFTKFFVNGSLIFLQANSSLGTTGEYIFINQVTNATSMTLLGKPQFNSTASAKYRTCPAILPANFAYYNTEMYTADDSQKGNNAVITGNPSFGNNLIGTTMVVDSGKGYNESEQVTLYLWGGISDPVIVNGGLGYSNGDTVVFSGNCIKQARGTAVTDGTGKIVDIDMTYYGAGYVEDPSIKVKTRNGTGAILSSKVTEFNRLYEVKGRVVKKGLGKGKGYFSTTRGFLNSDKYLHDSYYYQDFSYQFNTPISLAKYKDLLYTTFHIAGYEMFGEFKQSATEDETISILDETVTIS